VWHVKTAAAHPCGRHFSYPSSAHTFKSAMILPHAVEIRMPVQIHRFMNHYIAP
jgi:hypothetical protein